MTKRLNAMKRIQRVREQLKRIEESKLARLNREEADLEAKRQSILRSLNDDPSLHGLFVDDMAKRLRRVTERSLDLRQLKEVQTRHVMEQTRHFRQAENLVDALARDKARTDEKTLLDSMIDRLAVDRRGSSLP
jgi:hypothetical protein